MSKLIHVKVKSVWQGKIAIRDKYYREAMNQKCGIVIDHKSQQMTLSTEDVVSKTVGTSEKPFYDRFSKETHFLIYYTWKPDPPEQVSLF